MNLGIPLIAITTVVFPFFVHFNSLFNYYYDYAKYYLSQEPFDQVFDFVVVGSGSSGAVVAYRLAQHYNVLLLEAGGDPVFLSSIPGVALDLLGYDSHDWNYKSVPQSNVGLSNRNQQFHHNRGKVLGGCSTLNYMMYLRGHPLDYDNWANLTNDDEWKYENLLPFFKKSLYEYDGKFQHNKKHYETSPYGFLSVSKIFWERMLDTFFESGRELGFKTDIDANGPQAPGLGTIEVTQHHGERHSTYAAILRRSSSIKNLRIFKHSQVTKIRVDKSGKASGVWYYRHGKKHFATARKEVILSAGAYDSPKLLLLSGIGPKEELKKLGITPKLDLPVGKNLQDHFGVLMPSFSSKEHTSLLVERDFGLSDFYEYFTKGTGFLTAPTAITAQFFFSSSKARKDWPDYQAFFIPIAPSKYILDSFGHIFSIKKEVLSEVMNPLLGKDGFSVFSLLVRPKSRGQITLKDKNPFSDPLIDPMPFTHPDDMLALIEGVNASLRLVEETKAFEKVDGKYETVLSLCSMHQPRSNAYWDCYIRHTATTIWHPVGTTRMGRPEDPTTVVDSKLRVLGTRGLRVIDSSIMPVIVNANTNAPAILIGEKGADSVLEYWSHQYLVCDKLDHLKFRDDKKCYYFKSNKTVS